jgi:hypothetical protein
VDDRLPDLPIGGYDGFLARAVTNSGGDEGVLVVDHHGVPQLLLATRDDDERLDAVVVGGLVVSRPGNAASLAGWLGRGAGRAVAEPAGWASWVGLGVLLLLVAFTLIGALTVAGWLVGSFGG